MRMYPMAKGGAYPSKWVWLNIVIWKNMIINNLAMRSRNVELIWLTFLGLLFMKECSLLFFLISCFIAFLAALAVLAAGVLLTDSW